MSGTIGVFPPKILSIIDIDAPVIFLPRGGPKTPPGLILTNSKILSPDWLLIKSHAACSANVLLLK